MEVSVEGEGGGGEASYKIVSDVFRGLPIYYLSKGTLEVF